MNGHAAHPQSKPVAEKKSAPSSHSAVHPDSGSRSALHLAGGALSLWPLHSEAHELRVIQRAPDGPAPSPTSPTSAPTVIVGDTQTVLPGQMRRSEFLGTLRSAVTAACDAELAEVGRSTADCPYLSTALSTMDGKSAPELERTVVQHAQPGEATASAWIAAVVSRVRGAVRVWKTTGSITGVPDGVSTATGGLPVQGRFEPSAPVSGPTTMHPSSLQKTLGDGERLEPGLRSDMESRFGAQFDAVRVHKDTAAGTLSRQLSARAFTVGEHVAFAPGQYRPDTLPGKLLIAHELAHTVQQLGGQARPGMSHLDEQRHEQTADQAVADAMTGQQPGAALSLNQAGLRFQGCSEKEKPKPLFETLRNETDVYTLTTTLGRATDAELTELSGQAPGSSVLSLAVRWEQAWRGRQWSRLGTLARTRGEGFVEAYIDRVVTAIAAGNLGIRIDGSDPGFAGWARSQVRDLGSHPTGFRLIVELLATGQTVDIRKSTGGQETERVFTDADPDAGRLVTTGADGRPLPPNQQRRGTPTGSRIAFNPDLAQNQTTVGRDATGNTALIHADPTVTFGHELIHALHNARGENVAPPPGVGVLTRVLGQPNFLVRNPVTGRTENPEELGTITGDKSFGAPSEATGTPTWATSFNVTTDITENALRAERGLEQRISHHGGTTYAPQTVNAGETLDQVVGRYYLDGGAVISAPLRAAIRAAVVATYPLLATRPWPAGVSLNLPHGEYISLHALYIQGGSGDVAELATKLKIR